MPSERQWAGQGRWFRCEVMEIAGLDHRIAGRSGSLRDALSAPAGTGPGSSIGPLTATCATVTLTEDSHTVLGGTFVSCEREHDVELVGAYTAPDGDYPSRHALGALQSSGCRAAGASYVGVSAGELLRAGSATYTFAADISEEQWSAGVRSAWCFYGSSQRRSGSVRGLGAFPYAAP
jgi:hypothetical protein